MAGHLITTDPTRGDRRLEAERTVQPVVAPFPLRGRGHILGTEGH